MHKQTFLIALVLSVAYGQDRKITSKLNPNCSDCTSEQTLVYIKAEGPKDTIHQVWDFTTGAPTIIYAISSHNSSMSIEWDRQEPIKFALNDSKYSFAASIDKIYEYNDLKDIGHIDPSSMQHEHSLRRMSWHRNSSVLTEKEASVVLVGHNKNNWDAGYINIKLDFLPFNGYAVELPHLVHTSNSTLVDVGLVNLSTWRGFNSSRFALHFVLVSTDSETETMRYTMRKSLDDEHTPGVFEIIEIKTPESYKSDDGGFIQFRPVGYTEPLRGVSSSTNAHISNFTKVDMPNKSTLGVFYRDVSDSDLLVQDMFISFGLPGDGFYKKHNYTAWSFTMGYGKPPIEGFSLFVIMIISVGLGVPVLLAVSGITYVLVRRYRQRNAPARFIDDE